MRACVLCVWAVALGPGPAFAWSEATHQKMTADALSSVRWLDRYQNLKVTPFRSMLRDVLGRAKAVGPGAFHFKDAATRQRKHKAYLSSTASMPNPSIQKLARSLLLSNQLDITYTIGEKGRPVSARQVLTSYSGEPDWGMDKGLDASSHQKLMGGTDPKQTSSQGFRHMSFLLGRMGEAPNRAQLFFDLGAKAIEKGHPYWGFRFTAWGMHYLEDMGTPVHTNMLPTLKYIRIKGMLRPRDASGKRRFNKGVITDLVRGSAQINANYHFLYEHYVDRAYTAKDSRGQALSSAVKGDGKQPGWFRRLFAPRSITKLARRRAWSRLSTPGIARNAIRFFTGKFRQPDKGAPDNTVGSVNKEIVQNTVAGADRRMKDESKWAFSRRIASRGRMLRSTRRQFHKNGAAVRQAVHIFGQRINALR